MKTGSPKFNGIAVMEVTASFIGPSQTLQAKAAFVNSLTGHTHGSTTCTQWSPETIEQLQRLREAMENDLIKVHFEGDTVVSKEAPGPQSPIAKVLGGIGEQLYPDETGIPPVG